jgi:hypothetical protein
MRRLVDVNPLEEHFQLSRSHVEEPHPTVEYAMFEKLHEEHLFVSRLRPFFTFFLVIRIMFDVCRGPRSVHFVVSDNFGFSVGVELLLVCHGKLILLFFGFECYTKNLFRMCTAVPFDAQVDRFPKASLKDVAT